MSVMTLNMSGHIEQDLVSSDQIQME